MVSLRFTQEGKRFVENEGKKLPHYNDFTWCHCKNLNKTTAEWTTYSRLRWEGCAVVGWEKVGWEKAASKRWPPSLSGPSPTLSPLAGHWPPVSELHLIHFGMEAFYIHMGGVWMNLVLHESKRFKSEVDRGITFHCFYKGGGVNRGFTGLRLSEFTQISEFFQF